MRHLKWTFVVTAVVGVLSLVTFGLERLALTDIFHGEHDVRLEWAIVNVSLLPMGLFHILGLLSAVMAMRHIKRCGDLREGASERLDTVNGAGG